VTSAGQGVPCTARASWPRRVTWSGLRRVRPVDIRGVEGFRVDGPDGRIGTVTSVSSIPGAAPDTITVVTPQARTLLRRFFASAGAG
jgi:hypothetical protein